MYTIKSIVIFYAVMGLL